MTAYRRPLAWLVLVALLFVQVANAAHACGPERSMPAGALAVSSIAEPSSGAMPDCAEMSAAATDDGFTSSPLCVEHCTHATQAAADAQVPVLHWLPAPLLGVFLVLSPIRDAFDAVAFPEAPGMGRSIAPEIPILLGRFLS